MFTGIDTASSRTKKHLDGNDGQCKQRQLLDIVTPVTLSNQDYGRLQSEKVALPPSTTFAIFPALLKAAVY